MGKGRKASRNKASWVTYKLNGVEEFYQLNFKGELIKQDNQIIPHHTEELRAPTTINEVQPIKVTTAADLENARSMTEGSGFNPFEIDVFDDLINSFIPNSSIPTFTETDSLFNDFGDMRKLMSEFSTEPLLLF